ncbi:class I adenylate-forming enzyme family protein [Streptomyces gamaensis]|uniref:Class I adenylate-forming enzyme family protein n=1 Tax=Streptomyces gamaensis TaxID=1763542 RepID=A0ABW0YWA1_9ACTN
MESLLGSGPDNSVWASGTSDITRGEARTRVARLKELFAIQGVKPRSTVALNIPPSFTYLWALFALWECGASVMLLDHRLTPGEVEKLIDLTRPQFHITSNQPAKPLIPFEDEREILLKPLRDGQPAGTDHVLYQFTSGSTGAPKVIGRSAASLLAEVERFSRLPEMPKKGERVLLLNSLTHSFGLVGGVLYGTLAGATLVFPQRIGARDILALAAEHQVEVISGVPAHFDLLSRIDNPPKLSRLRLAISGGEALTTEVFERFEQRFRVRIGQAYGMTETGIITTDLAGVFPPPWVGLPAPGLEVDVRDGELYVRMDESPYPYQSQSVQWADGWLRTFDLAERDAESGAVSVKGRSDSMVVVGGLNVDLTEVEALLRGHRQVGEAVVVYGGEAIEAYVSVSSEVSGAELAAWCRERLSAHKVPRRFHLMPELPRTSNGKLVRGRDLLHAAHARSRARADARSLV